MKALIFAIYFSFLALVMPGQALDTTSASSGPITLKNEIGLGLSLTIPTGFYRTHMEGQYPGISVQYFRNIGTSKRINHFIGGEIHWIDLAGKKARVTEIDEFGSIFEYTSWADPEYVSLTLWYRALPDLNFRFWPYFEAGFGGAVFYTLERDRYPGVDDEEDEVVVDIRKSRVTPAFKLGTGVQYFIYSLNAYLDLSGRFNYHGLVRYDTIDDRPLLPGEKPVVLLNEKKSHAFSYHVKLSINFLFQ